MELYLLLIIVVLLVLGYYLFNAAYSFMRAPTIDDGPHVLYFTPGLGASCKVPGCDCGRNTLSKNSDVSGYSKDMSGYGQVSDQVIYMTEYNDSKYTDPIFMGDQFEEPA